MRGLWISIQLDYLMLSCKMSSSKQAFHRFGHENGECGLVFFKLCLDVVKKYTFRDQEHLLEFIELDLFLVMTHPHISFSWTAKREGCCKPEESGKPLRSAFRMKAVSVSFNKKMNPHLSFAIGRSAVEVMSALV